MLFERAYRSLGPRYLVRALFLQQQALYPGLALAVAAASFYVDMSTSDYIRLTLVACALQLAYSLLTVPVERRLTRPVVAWQRGDRSEQATVAAWRAAASLPWQMLRHQLFSPTLGLFVWLAYVAWTAFLAWQQDLSFTSALFIYVAVAVIVSYATALRFLTVERIVRPVLEDIGTTLPAGAEPTIAGMSLRARLLAALPALNVITAVLADGIARGGERQSWASRSPSPPRSRSSSRSSWPGRSPNPSRACAPRPATS